MITWNRSEWGYISLAKSISFAVQFVINYSPYFTHYFNFKLVSSITYTVKCYLTAFETLLGGGSPLDAVVEGCHFCDMRPDVCGESVGPGRPNEQGETTLDALVMDG